MNKHLHTEMQEVYQTRQSVPTLTQSLTPSVEGSKSGPSTAGSNQSPAHSGLAATIWTDFDMHHRSVASNVLVEICRYSEEKCIPRDKDKNSKIYMFK